MLRAVSLDRLLADGKRQVRIWGSVRQKRADSVQIASTIDSAENEETHENRSTVKRHGGR